MTPAPEESTGALDRVARSHGPDVGFVLHGWPPESVGGVELHARDLARELIARGHRVHVLALDTREGREPYSTRDELLDGVALRRMAYRYHDHGALADLVKNDAAADVVLAWLAETPCDIVHVHHLTGWGMSALAAVNQVGQPLVMTLHDYWPLCPRGQMWSATVLDSAGPDSTGRGALCTTAEPEVCAACIAGTWPHLLPSQGGRAEGPAGEQLEDDSAAARARTTYALSMLELPQRLFTPSAAAREVYAAAGVPASRIQVVENGIAADELARAVERVRREGGATDGVRIGYLGSVQPTKGVLELARAVVAVELPELVLEVHGALHGYHGDASYVDELRALAEEHACIELHGGYTEGELPTILAGLEAVAAPSQWNEVFGLTVREARAAGLPVLVTDVGGLPAAAQGGDAGLIVTVGDQAALEAAVMQLASDPLAREQWRKAASEVRGVRAMALELERLYVETIVEFTGQEPDLVHALEGAPASMPVAETPEPEKRKGGLIARLFGKR